VWVCVFQTRTDRRFVLLRQGPTESLCYSDRDRQKVRVAQTGTDRRFVLLRQGPTEGLCYSDRDLQTASAKAAEDFRVPNMWSVSRLAEPLSTSAESLSYILTLSLDQHTIPYSPMAIWSILILSSNLTLGLWSGALPSGFTDKMYRVFVLHMRAIFSAHLTPGYIYPQYFWWVQSMKQLTFMRVSSPYIIGLGIHHLYSLSI
jgi:hypothetical protein